MTSAMPPGGVLVWNDLVNLVILGLLCCSGTIGNIFTISAIMVTEQLKKTGNIFIGNLAVSDLVIAILVIPVLSVSLFSNSKNDISICQFRWFTVLLVSQVGLLTRMLIAIESICRLSNCKIHRTIFTASNILGMLILVWSLAGGLVAALMLLCLGPDPCTNTFTVFMYFHVPASVCLMLLPLIVTMCCYIKILFLSSKHRKRAFRKHSNPCFYQDMALAKTNFCSFIGFLVCWIPFVSALVIASVLHQPTSLTTYSSWLIQGNSCFNFFFYGMGNKYFRETYVKLFYYCCCKDNLNFSKRIRQHDSNPADIRMHILPGYNIKSNQNAPSSQVVRVTKKPDKHLNYTLDL